MAARAFLNDAEDLSQSDVGNGSADGLAPSLGRVSATVGEHGRLLRCLRVEHDALRAEFEALHRSVMDSGLMSTVIPQRSPPNTPKSTTKHIGNSNTRPTSRARSPQRTPSETPRTTPRSRATPAWASTLSRPRSTSRDTQRSLSSERSRQSDVTSRRSPARDRGGTPLRERQNNTQDLFSLAKPLLSAGGVEQHAAALSAVERALRQGASPTQWRGAGTPMRAAVQAGRQDLVQTLLTHRADCCEKDDRGVALLHLAAFAGQSGICKLLLMAKAEVNVADQHGQTPLFFAPSRVVCEALHHRRADISLLNHKGQSALHLAGRAGISEVLLWLSSHVSKMLLELTDVHGASAAHYASVAGVSPQVLQKLQPAQPPSALRRQSPDRRSPSKASGHKLDSDNSFAASEDSPYAVGPKRHMTGRSDSTEAPRPPLRQNIPDTELNDERLQSPVFPPPRPAVHSKSETSQFTPSKLDDFIAGRGVVEPCGVSEPYSPTTSVSKLPHAHSIPEDDVAEALPLNNWDARDAEEINGGSSAQWWSVPARGAVMLSSGDDKNDRPWQAQAMREAGVVDDGLSWPRPVEGPWKGSKNRATSDSYSFTDRNSSRQTPPGVHEQGRHDEDEDEEEVW